jgi:hypothetical protein
MKSQEAAFKASRKPAAKPKQATKQQPAPPLKIIKNASRNERRKAARKRASQLRASKAVDHVDATRVAMDEESV